MKITNKPSFEYKTARKDHICMFCGDIIPKGTKYYSKSEYSKELRRLLEERTGFDIYTIKKRTHFWYVDKVSWAFCSLKCMSFFTCLSEDKLPEEVKKRKQDKINSIVNNISDTLNMMASLGGLEDKRKQDPPCTC